jgi:hypothetical protein
MSFRGKGLECPGDPGLELADNAGETEAARVAARRDCDEPRLPLECSVPASAGDPETPDCPLTTADGTVEAVGSCWDKLKFSCNCRLTGAAVVCIAVDGCAGAMFVGGAGAMGWCCGGWCCGGWFCFWAWAAARKPAKYMARNCSCLACSGEVDTAAVGTPDVGTTAAPCSINTDCKAASIESFNELKSMLSVSGGGGGKLEDDEEDRRKEAGFPSGREYDPGWFSG